MTILQLLLSYRKSREWLDGSPHSNLGGCTKSSSTSEEKINDQCTTTMAKPTAATLSTTEQTRGRATQRKREEKRNSWIVPQSVSCLAISNLLIDSIQVCIYGKETDILNSQSILLLELSVLGQVPSLTLLVRVGVIFKSKLRSRSTTLQRRP